MTQPIERSKREPLFLCTEFPSNYVPCTVDCWKPKYIWAKKYALHVNYGRATVSIFLTIKYLITVKYWDFILHLTTKFHNLPHKTTQSPSRVSVTVCIFGGDSSQTPIFSLTKLSKNTWYPLIILHMKHINTLDFDDKSDRNWCFPQFLLWKLRDYIQRH